MLVIRSLSLFFILSVLLGVFAHAQNPPATQISPKTSTSVQSFNPSSFTAAYPPDLQPTYKNLAYADKSAFQVLDLFIPDGKGPFPLVINIHGGAYLGGSKERLVPAIAKALLESGIAVASLNYRLSEEAHFPAAVQDVKAAVRYLRAHAENFRIDGKRFLAFGQSAGGNLASMLGTSSGAKEFDDPALGNMDQSSAVMGVVDWYGPTDFLQMDRQAKLQGCAQSSQTHESAESAESQYLGCALDQCPELAERANPITYVDRHTPPFLLQKGDQDCTVPVGQSKLLYDKLKAAKVPVLFDLLQNAGHGDPAFLAPANVQRVVDFIRATLQR